MHGEYSLKYLLSTVLKILANLRSELIIKKEKKHKPVSQHAVYIQYYLRYSLLTSQLLLEL